MEACKKNLLDLFDGDRAAARAYAISLNKNLKTKDWETIELFPANGVMRHIFEEADEDYDEIVPMFTLYKQFDALCGGIQVMTAGELIGRCRKLDNRQVHQTIGRRNSCSGEGEGD